MKKNQIYLHIHRWLMVGILAPALALGVEPDAIAKPQPVLKKMSSATIAHIKREKDLLMDGLKAAGRRFSGKTLTPEEKQAFNSVAKRALILIGLIAAGITGTILYTKYKEKKNEEWKGQKEHKKWLMNVHSPKYKEQRKLYKDDKEMDEYFTTWQQNLDQFSGKILTREQAKKNYKKDTERKNHLLLAAQQKNSELVKQLLENGVDPNFMNHDGIIPLLEMIDDYGDLGIAKLLLENGANPNFAETNNFDFPLHLGFREDIKTLLLQHGADPNIPNIQGKTPLHLAHLFEIKLLLQYGAKPNIQDYKGNTPLMRATMNLSARSVEALLRGGADISIKNNDGKTVLDVQKELAEIAPETAQQVREVFLKFIQAKTAKPGLRQRDPETQRRALPKEIAEMLLEYVVAPEPRKRSEK